MLCNTYTQIKITKQKNSKLVIKFALSVTSVFRYVWLCEYVCVCVCTAIPRIDWHSKSRTDASAVKVLTGLALIICRGEQEDFLRKVKLG